MGGRGGGGGGGMPYSSVLALFSLNRDIAGCGSRCTSEGNYITCLFSRHTYFLVVLHLLYSVKYSSLFFELFNTHVFIYLYSNVN